MVSSGLAMAAVAKQDPQGKGSRQAAADGKVYFSCELARPRLRLRCSPFLIQARGSRAAVTLAGGRLRRCPDSRCGVQPRRPGARV